MNQEKEMIVGAPIEVGYILTFGDGRKDRFGQFMLVDQEPGQFNIFKRMVEIEPTTAKASYIFVNLRLKQPGVIDLDSIEYRRKDIEIFLQSMAKRGIKN